MVLCKIELYFETEFIRFMKDYNTIDESICYFIELQSNNEPIAPKIINIVKNLLKPHLSISIKNHNEVHLTDNLNNLTYNLKLISNITEAFILNSNIKYSNLQDYILENMVLYNTISMRCGLVYNG